MFFLLEIGGSGGKGGMLTMLLPFILMFAVMYFLILRPQKRKEKARKALLAKIRKHDRIVTSGGVHGVIISVREHEVILKIDDAKDVKIKIDRSSIATVLEASHDDEDEDEDEEESKKTD